MDKGLIARGVSANIRNYFRIKHGMLDSLGACSYAHEVRLQHAVDRLMSTTPLHGIHVF